MPTGTEHKYVNKTEHVIRYAIGDLIEVAPEREEWRPMLRCHEQATITRIYDVITEAANGLGTVTDTWVVFMVIKSAFNGAMGREFEDQIENVQLVEVG